MYAFSYDYETEIARNYVIKYYKNFLSQKQIAEQMGVSVNTIRKIINARDISRSSKIKLKAWAVQKKKEFDNLKGEYQELI